MKLPIHFKPDLTHERLTTIASILLEEYNNTLDNLNSPYDSNYGIGCTAFDRQRNRIITVAIAKTYPWLNLLNGAYDLVFSIGSVPCRFSTDNPKNPKKNATLIANRYQQSLIDETESDEPCRFCFVLDKGYNDDQEPRVVFLGFNAANVLKCEWKSDNISTLHSVTPVVTPNAVEIGKPAVTPKRSSTDGGVGQAGEK